ncbi:MAG TPA: alpha/beta hydrolase [Candidatus Limnocylindrales bacterium]
MPSIRRTGILAAFLAAPALAYRFAVVYRERAGLPRRRPGRMTPAERGLPFEETVVHSPAGELPAWFIPAPDGAPGPGVVLVHGWESNRDRTLPNAQVLHAAGFHVLTFDVRGHGDNPPETLPISVAEFRDDAAAALEALLARPEVTVGAFLGHSLGAVGAILAAADAGERCAALVSTSAPADPRRLTRQTFRLARLPIPEPFATPLAELTTRVYLRPRGHTMGDLSASRAVARYAGPVLLVHGALDSVVPAAHLARLEKAARRGAARRLGAGEPVGGPIEATLIPDGHHSWLYEHPAYRRTVAHFLATSLGGPLAADEAADRAASVDAPRIPDPDESFAAVALKPGGRRTVAELFGSAQPVALEDEE